MLIFAGNVQQKTHELYAVSPIEVHHYCLQSGRHAQRKTTRIVTRELGQRTCEAIKTTSVKMLGTRNTYRLCLFHCTAIDRMRATAVSTVSRLSGVNAAISIIVTEKENMDPKKSPCNNTS